MAAPNIEQEYHASLYIIFYKFITGIFEVLLGAGMVFFGKQIIDLYQTFVYQQVLEDPHDLIAAVSEKVVPYLLEHQGSVIFLLIIIGIAKIAGAVGLWYHKHWGLDIIVGLTVLLLPFQIADLITQPTLTKIVFLALNLLITLYLVEFQPRSYFRNLHHRVRRRK